MVTRIFAAAIWAQHPRNGQVQTGVRVFGAVNTNEATDMGVAEARTKWPAQQGWTGHSASVVQIPQNWIDAAASR